MRAVGASGDDASGKTLASLGMLQKKAAIECLRERVRNQTYIYIARVAARSETVEFHEQRLAEPSQQPSQAKYHRLALAHAAD